MAELLSGRGGKIRKGRGRDGRRGKGGTILCCLWLQDIINLKGKAGERGRRRKKEKKKSTDICKPTFDKL